MNFTKTYMPVINTATTNSTMNKSDNVNVERTL